MMTDQGRHSLFVATYVELWNAVRVRVGSLVISPPYGGARRYQRNDLGTVHRPFKPTGTPMDERGRRCDSEYFENRTKARGLMCVRCRVFAVAL
jgi:hypothetical protein